MSDPRMVSDQQRRSRPRYSAFWAVQIKATDWAEALHLVTSNVCDGGLFIQSSQTIASGTYLAIELALPDNTTAHVEGRVAHAVSVAAASEMGTTPGFGIRIDPAFSKELRRIERLAASNVVAALDVADEGQVTMPVLLHRPKSTTSEYATAHPATSDGRES